MADRMGDWTVTASGVRWFPENPRPEDVVVDDIAGALSKICRFGGHCEPFYSVAEHSVLVSYVVPPEHAWQALWHDGAEAWYGDIPRPLKRVLGDAYARLENLGWLALCEALDVDPVMHPLVKQADNAVLFAERRALFPPDAPEWGWSVPAADVHIRALPPPQARALFLSRYADLLALRRPT